MKYLIYTLTFLFLPFHFIFAADTEPPEITSFSMSPTMVDTTTEGQEVAIEFSATDNDTGISLVSATLRSTDGSNQGHSMWPIGLVSGDNLNGVYVGIVTLPRGSAEGEWIIDVIVQDRLHNRSQLTSEKLENEFGDGVATLVNVNAASDTEPPEITSFSMSPTMVDTTTEGQEVAIEFSATDNDTGISLVSATLRSTDGSNQGHSMWPIGLVSGDNLNGVYVGTVTLPRGSAEGEWIIDVIVQDRLHNRSQLTSEKLENEFGDGVATLVNVNAASDTEPPEITSFSMSPTMVDTTTEGQEVAIEFSATDNDTGISLVSATLRSTDGSNQGHSMWPIGLVSGDNLNGVYVGTVTLPRGSAEGEWIIDVIVQDRLHNRSQLTSEKLENEFGDGVATLVNVKESIDGILENSDLVDDEEELNGYDEIEKIFDDNEGDENRVSKSTEKKYEEYKDKYKNKKTKDYYKEIKKWKKGGLEEVAKYQEYKSIYKKYKHLSKPERGKNLSEEDRKKYELYRKYKGYKTYKELREKIE